jgi:hypothetical protein
MNDENERSVASAGSHGAVAWAVMLSSGCIYGLHEEQWEATAICEAMKTHDISHALIVPLYRQPTLTEQERDEIEGIVSDFQEIAEFNEERCHPHYAEKAKRRAAMLIGLLERLG